MDTTRVMARGWSALFMVVVVACSGSGRKEAGAPAPTPGGPAATAASDSAAFAALTRQKVSDEDYRAAIAALENASGATDAAEDIAAGRRQLLATPTAQSSPVFPGVSLTSRDLAEGVRIVRITGFVEGSESPPIVRFQMLARRYATAYNSAMLPAVR